MTTPGGALGAPVYSGLASNRWNYTAYANAAGAWLIAVNGTDTPIGYNAGAWAPLPAITGSSGAITLNPANLAAVSPHQGRLLFTEADTLHVWFPAAGAVGGAMQLLDLGSVFNKGGRLIGVATWSWQFGVTADEYAVFMTDQGQIALFSGIDPGNASDWTLTGVYDFGPPLGPKATLVEYGADLILITSDGISPLSQAIKLDRSQDNTVALTAMIKDAFAQAVRAYAGNYGWQGILYPGDTTSSDPDADGGSLGIFNVPVTTLGTSMQYVSEPLDRGLVPVPRHRRLLLGDRERRDLLWLDEWRLPVGRRRQRLGPDHHRRREVGLLRLRRAADQAVHDAPSPAQHLGAGPAGAGDGRRLPGERAHGRPHRRRRRLDHAHHPL